MLPKPSLASPKFFGVRTDVIEAIDTVSSLQPLNYFATLTRLGRSTLSL